MKLFTEKDFKSIYTERENDYQDMADIANAKLAEFFNEDDKLASLFKVTMKLAERDVDSRSKYNIAIKGIKQIHADGSYTDIAAEIAREVLKECGE